MHRRDIDIDIEQTRMGLDLLGRLQAVPLEKLYLSLPRLSCLFG